LAGDFVDAIDARNGPADDRKVAGICVHLSTPSNRAISATGKSDEMNQSR
jgi:hypothetical protein